MPFAWCALRQQHLAPARRGSGVHDVFWCVFEAIHLTFVMTSLVIDTLSNLAGTQLTEGGVRFRSPFMLFVVLVSYAVALDLHQTRSSPGLATVIKIGVVEWCVVREVVFLYASS